VPPGESAWRHIAKRFCDNGFVSAQTAGKCSSFARIVTAGIATVAFRAVPTPGAASGAAPTGATSKAPKDGSITATASDAIAERRSPTGVTVRVPFRSLARHYLAVGASKPRFDTVSSLGI
jgi:hypothetical protein